MHCVSKFDSTGILDLSSAPPQDHRLIEDVLKAAVDTNRTINRLVLDGCNITHDILSALSAILSRVEEFSCKYVGLLDEHLAVLCGASPYLSISSLDLSHNELTSGFVLSKFINTCINLNELRICDLALTLGEEEVITSLCGLNNLESVDVSFSGLLRGHLVERLLSSCDSLVSLKMDDCDLSRVYFTSTWLPNLRELSLVGCQITEFDSLIEWVSMGCVQLLDLSATDITTDHVRTLIDTRLMCPPMVIRLVRCPNVECNARVFADVILHFIDQRSFPLKKQYVWFDYGRFRARFQVTVSINCYSKVILCMGCCIQMLM
uniref:F-box domain-containing protein n=1 Tax=Angiostrongylus cantonensis TaxID=6313 RepID=A0A0K0D0S6_ANGCA